MDLYAEDENYRRAVNELTAVRCIHCDSINVLTPAAHGRRVLSMTHERGCPEHEDFGDDSDA